VRELKVAEVSDPKAVFSRVKRCKKKYCSTFWLYLANSVQPLTN
jgi:hypothetical protein